MAVFCALAAGVALCGVLLNAGVISSGWAVLAVFVAVTGGMTVMFLAMESWAEGGGSAPSGSDSDGGYSCGGGNDY
ncbi:hypothetical protein ABT301_33345 [Streptomyces sp. NPDC000987]|uniref:hypothetical protein n=1 Tax=Streptomyces sp. NPDC000987 TaxID=3154374 RepID=UPI00331A9208